MAFLWRGRRRSRVDGVQGLPRGAPYYNECENDRWVTQLVFPDLREGFFLEVGAADGISGSSCFFLEKHLGWRGICIEAHPTFYARLVENRPASRCVHACLSERRGSAEFVLGTGDGPFPFLSGLTHNLERYKSKSEEILERGQRITMPTTLLEDVLETNAAPAIIDYACFDIDGSELAVLRSFPFSRWRFRALTLECDGKIWDAMTQLLEGHGYAEVKNPFNLRAPWERYWLYCGGNSG